MKKLSIVFAVICITLPFLSQAQDDVFSMLDSISKPETEYATATFKSSRIITGHSVEQMKEGQLEFRISHRFGTLNSGFYNMYVLDAGTIFLSTEYGVKDWLMIGLGRASLDKTFNGFIKTTLFRQAKGKKHFPVTITYLGTTFVNSSKDDPTLKNYFSNRLGYVNQLLIARKVTNALSLQLSPIYIHRNLVPTVYDQNDIFSCGIGGRYKITNRIAFTAEYYYVLRSKAAETKYYNPLSFGFDIETGGHVFSFMLTNSFGMIENQYIANNTGRWSKGDIHFGFNISRSFTLYGKK